MKSKWANQQPLAARLCGLVNFRNEIRKPPSREGGFCVSATYDDAANLMLPKISLGDEPKDGSDADELERVSVASDLFRQHGALFLENAVDRKLVAKLAKAFAKKYQSLSQKELKDRDAMVGDRRYMVTVDIKKPFNDPGLYANPRWMPILESLLSPHLRIVSYGVVVALPGADDQSIHLDHPPLFESAANGSQKVDLPPWAVTLVVPLVEIDRQIGPTAIWPGTHLAADRIERLQTLMESPGYSDAQKPETKLGDAYMMDYRVIHGGLANDSDRPRPILYLVYGRPWFRDGFNFSSQPAVQISKKQRKKVPSRWQGLFRG